MSFTATFFPIIAALAAPEGSYFKHANTWFSVNSKQAYFIEHFFSKKPELAHFAEKELRSWGSEDATYLTEIASKNGFALQFEPFKQGEFGSLSILDVAVQWIEAGTTSTLKNGKATYKAAVLENNFEVFETASYAHPIAKIKTQSNDIVYMAIADEPAEEFVLLQKVNMLQSLLAAERPADYDSVKFPCVKLDQMVDISWLLNMRCPNFTDGCEDWSIVKAMQQTKFCMNEHGAHVQSAVGTGFATTSCKKYLIIDKPFYVWIERPGCSMPIFAGYIDTSEWIVAE